MKYFLDFYTSYSQVIVKDKNSDEDTGSMSFWTKEATLTRLAIGKNTIGIGLECYGHFKGEVHLLNTKKSILDISKFDHIVEGGFLLNSGKLHFTDCPNNEIQLEILLNPGVYRIRVYSCNLKSVIEDSGDDYYLIEVWPDDFLNRLVIKQYQV